MLQPDLISQLAETSEYDLNDLARLTHHHYQELLDRGMPADLAGQLARDLHTAWLAAIYGEAILMRDRSLASILSARTAAVEPV